MGVCFALKKIIVSQAITCEFGPSAADGGIVRALSCFVNCTFRGGFSCGSDAGSDTQALVAVKQVEALEWVPIPTAAAGGLSVSIGCHPLASPSPRRAEPRFQQPGKSQLLQRPPSQHGRKEEQPNPVSHTGAVVLGAAPACCVLARGGPGAGHISRMPRAFV